MQDCKLSAALFLLLGVWVWIVALWSSSQADCVEVDTPKIHWNFLYAEDLPKKMTSIGSNIASSSGVGSSEGPLVPAWVSLTAEEHLENCEVMIRKYFGDHIEEFHFKDIEENFLGAAFSRSIAKIVKALRMDPCGNINNLLSLIPGPLALFFYKTTPLHWAVLMDDRVMVHYMLSSGMVITKPPSIYHRSALSYAIICGNLDIVKDLLEYKADVFSSGAFFFMVREKDSMFDILKMILADNVNACDHLEKTTLHHATKEGFADVVAYLLNEKADINLKDKDGCTPLHHAAQKGSSDVVTLLLQQNAHVNVVNNLRQSPLHFAARQGVTNIVSLLVDHNAVVDALDNNGWTPLFHSLINKEVDISNALIVIGANVHVKDVGRNNTLHLAIRAYRKKDNMMDIVKLLRERDVDANAKNSKGWSPFFASVVEGHTEVVKELLQSKEKIKLMEECNGQTAIQVAFDNDHEHIKRVLMEFDDVSRYVETLYRDRQVYVDAANAILVGAALIASVTFASWLQPPLGYTTSYLDLAPSSSNINYVDVQHNPSLRAFWVFNTLSFYFAIGTVVFGARSVLPRRHIFINGIVKKLHQNLLVTSILLACSVFCVIVAFGIAGCIVLTPILKFQWYMIVPTMFGGLVCLVSLGFLFKSMVEDNLKMKKTTYDLYL